MAQGSPPVRISVVVPFHGAPDELRPCLAALGVSDHDAFEVICVDDGSPVPLSGVPGLVRLDRRSGPAAARNAGAARARGEVLAFIDADVLVAPDTLTLFERALAASDADAVQGCYTYPGCAMNAATRFLEDFQEYKVRGLRERNIGTLRGGCFAVRAATFRAVGGFDERFAEPSQEDTDLGWRIARAGGTIRLDPAIRVRHIRPVPGLPALCRRYLRLFKSMVKLHLRARLTDGRTRSGPRPAATMSRADQTWRPAASLAALLAVVAGLASVSLTGWNGLMVVVIAIIAYMVINRPFLVFVYRQRRLAQFPGELAALVGFHVTLGLAVAIAVVEFPWKRY